MALTPQLDINLTFSLEEDGIGGAVDDLLTGTVTASGSEVEVFASNPEMLMRGRSLKLSSLRLIAAEIAAYGLSITLSGPDGVIAKVGAVDAPVLQRVVTGSPHIRLGSPAALAPLLRRRGAAITGIPLPPRTLFPIVPTVSRGVRRKITTTHYTPGSGRPRLIFVIGSENWNGQMPREFDLLPTTTVIGSRNDADLLLDGLEPLHAEIRHTADDEYILYPFGQMAGSSKTGEETGRRDGGQVLRTGARIELGPWRMAYFREEFADHGRPHGGRVGGELSRQKPQRDTRPGH